MNFVFISPNFPENYYHFCLQLKNQGARVLGISEQPYENLRPELQQALTDYFCVQDMKNYEDVFRAVALFSYRYGKIDGLDSLNEFWLELDAALRTDFNIPGTKNDQIHFLKKKSEMKKVFQECGLRVARGQVVQSFSDAKDFFAKCKGPIVVKPDNGVGANETYKISTLAELESFWQKKSDKIYFFEEFVSGKIVTYDGLVDSRGEIVFSTSHEYSEGVMEVVNGDNEIYYYSLLDIPEDLENFGRKLVKRFATSKMFFHFEFFRTPDNDLVALEVNMRPPGGLTLEMFNYSCDMDIYKIWASVVCDKPVTDSTARKYYTCYAGRKYRYDHAHSHAEILSTLKERLCCHQPMSQIFVQAMGNYSYIFRCQDFSDLISTAKFILKRS